MKITEILTQKIAQNSNKLTEFFAANFSKHPPLFYNSVDLRHSNFKIAPVDTNCFPAGFNNIRGDSMLLAKKITDEFLSKNFPQAKKILIIPENHTRNFRYLENVKNLVEIIGNPLDVTLSLSKGDSSSYLESPFDRLRVTSSDREVLIGTLIPEITDKTEIALENSGSLTLHPLTKNNNKIITKGGFEPDLIILNNDLSDGLPEIFANCQTPIAPAPTLGWYNRKKSHHFDIYNKLAQEFAQILDIDPWLISTMHKTCVKVDFKERIGIDCLANHVDEMLKDLTKKYQEYGIDEHPYCFVKADSGTYGIGVWPVFSAQEVLEINKKERNKMNMLKGSVQNTKVIIQEGITTFDRINGNIAEPMIYMVGGEVVGNLFRVNQERDEKISLNAAGANFFDLRNLEENQVQLGLEKSKITAIYAAIARLAALAASIENN